MQFDFLVRRRWTRALLLGAALWAAPRGGEAADFKIQRGRHNINGNTTLAGTEGPQTEASDDDKVLVVNIEPVVTANAFVRITDTQLTGAGVNAGLTHDSRWATCYVELISTSQIRFTRQNVTQDCMVSWEVVEYVGPSAGANEFIVRNQSFVTFANADTTKDTAAFAAAVTNINDCVVFVTGQGGDSGAATDYETVLGTGEMLDTTHARFKRGVASTGKQLFLSYAVVEFTGTQWRVQRVEYNYQAAPAPGNAHTIDFTSNPLPAGVQVGTVPQAVTPGNAINDDGTGDLTHVFIHVQKRNDNGEEGIDDFGHQVWVQSKTQLGFQLNGTVANPGKHTSVAWIIESTQRNFTPMKVWRGNGTIAATVSPVDTSLTYGPITTLSVASVFFNCEVDGNNTNFARPMLGIKLFDTSHIEIWSGQAATVVHHRWEVVEWPSTLAKDFKIQRGCKQLAQNDQEVTLDSASFDRVASLAKAFVRITGCQEAGLGANTVGVGQQADRVTCYVTWDSAAVPLGSKFKIHRTTGNNHETEVCWEIIEYTGPSGGNNEFVVRKQPGMNGDTVLSMASGTVTSNLSLAGTGVVDYNDVVPFVTGVANRAADATHYPSGLVTTSVSNPNAVFTRGTGANSAIDISYAAVEFVGSAWIIQRVQHDGATTGYDAANAIETEAIAAVASTAKAFIYAQKRVNNANLRTFIRSYGHEVWLSATNTVSFRLAAGADTPTDHESVAWVLENSQGDCDLVNVQRGNDTFASGDASPKTIALPVAAGDLGTASVFWNNSTDDAAGGTTEYPRPMISASLVNVTQIQTKRMFSGRNQRLRWEVVEWPTASRSIEATAYDTDLVTPLVGKSVKLYNNGVLQDTRVTDAAGLVRFASVCLSGTSILVVLISGDAKKATHVMATDGLTSLTGASGLKLYAGQVILDYNTGTSITNTDLTTGNTIDTDDGISSSGGNVTFGTTVAGFDTLRIESGKTYKPTTGTVTIGSASVTAGINVLGTFQPDTNAVSMTGNLSLGTTGVLTTTGTITMNGTAAQTISIDNATPANFTFNHLRISNTTNPVTVAANPSHATGFQVSGDLTIDAGATLIVQENAQVNSGGRLVMTGTSSAPTLRIGDTITFTVASGATLSTSTTSAKPVITKTAAGAGGFGFTVSGTLSVNGLTFTGPANADGFLFTGTGDVSNQRLDNVDFTAAADSGRHLTVRSAGALNMVISRPTFTTAHVGSVNIQAEDTSPVSPGGDDNVRVFVAAGDVTGAALATLDGNDRDDYKENPFVVNTPYNTSRVDWGIAFTSGITASEAGSETADAELQAARTGVQGSYSVTFNTAPSGTPSVDRGNFWPIGPRAYYIMGRKIGAGPTADQVVCVELAGNGTYSVGQKVATYTIPTADGEGIGPPVALILAPVTTGGPAIPNTPNTTGATDGFTGDTLAGPPNQVEDIFFGTTSGKLYRVRFDGTSTLKLCDAAGSGGNAFPRQPGSSPNICVEFTSPVSFDVFNAANPNRLFFGAIAGGPNNVLGGGDDTYKVYGVHMNTGDLISPAANWISPDVASPIRAPFGLLSQGTSGALVYAGTDEVGAAGAMIKLDGSTGFNVIFSVGVNKFAEADAGAADHFRAPIALGAFGDPIIGAHMGGKVLCRKALNLTPYASWPAGGYTANGSGSASAVGGGVALGWDGTFGVNGWPTNNNLFFGDDAGYFYWVNGVNGTGLAPLPSYAQLDPPGARAAAAIRTLPLEGPFLGQAAGEGNYFYVGNNDGIVFWVNKFDPGTVTLGKAGVYLDAGAGKRVRDITSAFGRLFIPTNKGELFILPSKP